MIVLWHTLPQGPRRWDDGGAQGAEAYPDSKSYLDPRDFLMYQRWLKWSDKPRGLDHVQPSKEYFRCGHASHDHSGARPVQVLAAEAACAATATRNICCMSCYLVA